MAKIDVRTIKYIYGLSVIAMTFLYVWSQFNTFWSRFHIFIYIDTFCVMIDTDYGDTPLHNAVISGKYFSLDKEKSIVDVIAISIWMCENENVIYFDNIQRWNENKYVMLLNCNNKMKFF